MKRTDISVVVPVYNSEQGLPALVQRLESVLWQIANKYELILVNDGSKDGSWRVIGELSLKHPWIRGFDLMRNYGQHNALLCGIRAARMDIVVTLDDDLQNPPEEMHKLIELLDDQTDVVYGTPVEEQHGFFRDVASIVTKLALQSMMGAQTARSVSAYRAFRTCLRDAFSRFQSPFVSIDVLLTWGTSRFASVRIQHVPRQISTSQYTLRKLVAHAVNMMTGFSVLPLQISSWIGFGFTLFGMGVLVYVIGRYFLLGYSVPGFPFLASVIAIFSGAQLFALGIIGEYLARMHYRIMDRPGYAIRESLSATSNEL
ncbi:MAG: glycosyl transferase [Lentisphaerae bacterium GWF2_57_35]|nr:MAG: glycosyl transferase [Lentisphaerae bacterium GWF2_57_35]